MTPRLLALAALLLPGCATIVTGGSNQNLTVSTNPAGASCRVEREGAAVGIISPTPGTLRIEKSRHDLEVTCERAGHDATKVKHTSDFIPATFGNIIVGGLIGVAVDAISGANFSYPSELVVNLQVTGGPPVVQPERKKPEATVADMSNATPGAVHRTAAPVPATAEAPAAPKP